MLLLGVRFLFFYKDQKPLKNQQEVSFETTLLSEPRITARNQIFSAILNRQRITVFSPTTPEIHYGDTIKLSGFLKEKVVNGKTNFTLNIKNIESAKRGNMILSLSSFLRQKIINFYTKNLNSDEAGLLLGIVFGVKEYIPQNFLKDLKLAGVMHVIAASGMNVTMVGGFLSSIFLLFLRRQVALCLSILGIILYATLAELEPSIIRASIMGFLVFVAAIFGRQMWASYSLMLTGFTMLFWDPSLLYDIGFQLSFMATIGLLYLKPIFKNPILDSFQTTIFAQIATLPILIANFGTYSLWSVVVNGLVLWTVPLLMVVGGVSAVISLVIEPFARLTLYLSLPLLIFFGAVVKFFSGLGGVVKIESLSWEAILGYYFILASIILARK